MSEKKLLIGPKVRRLRKDQRLTQAQMAADLDISPAYLNLIEHNQRPVSAQVLIKIAAAYDINLADFAKDEAPELAVRLRALFADPALGDLRLSSQDFADMTALSPEASTAILALGERVARQRQMLQAHYGGHNHNGNEADFPGLTDPAHAARHFFERNSNYFAEIEDLADQVRDDLGITVQERGEAVVDKIVSASSFALQVLPARVMGLTLRRYDFHGRRLLLNQCLSPASRRFQIGVQFYLSQQMFVLERLVKNHEWAVPAAAKMALISLAGYASAATFMPYRSVLEAAQEASYDIDALAHDFAVTREQLAQRLTTLQRPGERGLTFFMARLDAAGNMTKRLSVAGNFSLIKSGATCPRWHVHEAATKGEAIQSDLVVLPDGSRFLSLAIPCKKPTLRHDMPGQPYVLAIGCNAQEAARTVYGAQMNIDHGSATPIGPSCRLCERLDCTYRAAPPANHEILIDEHRRDMMPYAFV